MYASFVGHFSSYRWCSRQYLGLRLLALFSTSALIQNTPTPSSFPFYPLIPPA